MGYVRINRDRPSLLTQAISTLYPLPGNNFHRQRTLPREHKGRGKKRSHLRAAAFDDLGRALVEQFEPDRTAEFARAVRRAGARSLDKNSARFIEHRRDQ